MLPKLKIEVIPVSRVADAIVEALPTQGVVREDEAI